MSIFTPAIIKIEGDYTHVGTFVITKQVNNRINRTFRQNFVYHFKPFSPKPDSTCVYIK